MTGSNSTADPTSQCVVCAGLEAVPVLTVDKAPLYPFRPAGADGTAVWFGALRIVRCTTCGHIYNRGFDRGHADDLYGASILTNTPVSPSMVKSVEGVADLILRHAKALPRVLEVGGGAGALSVALSQNAAAVHLVEPSRALAADRFEGTNITFHQVMFPVPELAGEAFDVVICRQVLEHVPDPLPFLAAMRTHLSADGLAYVEVPDADYIRVNRSVIDFHYPHVHYYRPATVQSLLRRAGFDVFETQAVKDGHDVAFLARAAAPAHVGGRECDDWTGEASALGERIDRGRRTLSSIDGPIALYGANAYSQALLGLYPDAAFSAMVDDTPFYRGQRVYGPGHEIAIEQPGGGVFRDIAAVLITAYLHDRAIAEKVRAFGYMGPIYTVRADSTTGNGGVPPSLFR